MESIALVALMLIVDIIVIALCKGAKAGDEKLEKIQIRGDEKDEKVI